MRYISFIVALFAVSVSAFADESPAIRLPMLPITPQTDPAPPVPKFVSAIEKGQLYVVESSVGLIAFQSPDGILNVMSSKGPLSVYGLFSDGSGEPEFRTFNSENLVIVSGIKPGKTELILVPVGVMESKSIVRQILTVSGEGPRPGPLPPNPPTPPKPVDPIPTPHPTDGNRVLILYESSELSTLPASQAVLMTSGKLREYLTSHCSKGPSGTPEFRIWDKDVDTTNVSQTWRDGVLMPRTSLPWLIVSNGTSGFAGELPKDEAGLLAKLKQYLGE